MARWRAVAPAGFVALAVVLALVLAACGVRPPGPPSLAPTRPASSLPPTTSPAAAAPVTISWSVWGDASEIAVNQRLAAAFTSRNPGIRVELIAHPWEEYFTWLEGEWAAGRSPDVMFLDRVAIYAAQGRLLNLTPYARADNFPLEDFYPELLRRFQLHGDIYGLPRDNDTKAIFFNKTLFENAGEPFPRRGWTWQDLRAAARKLTRPSAPGGPIYGFGYELDWWEVWAWQNGAELFDNPLAPTRVSVDTPEVAEAIQFLVDLTRVDHATPPVEVLRSGKELDRLFLQGRLAMVMTNHARVPTFARASDLRWDIVGLPRGKVRANVAGGAGYAIAATTPHPREAWELVKFLTSPEGQAMFVDTGLVVSARRSVREDNVFLRALPYDRTVFLEETELGRPAPQFEGSEQVDPAFARALLPAFQGERTVAEGLAELQRELAQVVARRSSASPPDVSATSASAPATTAGGPATRIAD